MSEAGDQEVPLPRARSPFSVAGPSASVALTGKVSCTTSSVLCAPIGFNTGGWLTAGSNTVIVTTSESARAPSLAMNVTL